MAEADPSQQEFQGEQQGDWNDEHSRQQEPAATMPTTRLTWSRRVRRGGCRSSP